MRFLDLTQDFSLHTPAFAGYPGPAIRWIKHLAFDRAGGQEITMTLHVSTHLDAPAHFMTRGKFISLEGVDGAGKSTHLEWIASRLRDLGSKKIDEAKVAQPGDEKQALAAKDGNDLVNVGMGLVLDGQAAKGLQLMQQGIAKGGLKRPDDAKLHLGIAQIVAGENAKAQATFRTVAGNDGTADLARLWALYARRAKA